MNNKSEHKPEMPFNHFGESLDSTPDFLSLKRQYEESLVDWNEEGETCGQVLENLQTDLHSLKENITFETRLKENNPLEQPTNL